MGAEALGAWPFCVRSPALGPSVHPRDYERHHGPDASAGREVPSRTFTGGDGFCLSGWLLLEGPAGRGGGYVALGIPSEERQVLVSGSCHGERHCLGGVRGELWERGLRRD